jgi:hypothetical protein
MFARFKRIFVLSAFPLAVTAWAFPPVPTQDTGTPTPPADGATVTLKGKRDLLEAPPVLAIGDSLNGTVAGSPASPGTGFELSASPNTKELIESPGAKTASGDPPGAPIPKMPAYTVTGEHVAVFRERDLNTADGMTDLSFKRHPGLRFGNFSHANENAAHELFLEDDWRNAKSDYFDMAHAMANGGDPAEGRMIVQAVKDEDSVLRGASDATTGLPAFDRTQVGHLDGDSKLLQIPEDPVDIPFVKVKW